MNNMAPTNAVPRFVSIGFKVPEKKALELSVILITPMINEIALVPSPMLMKKSLKIIPKHIKTPQTRPCIEMKMLKIVFKMF